MKRKINDNFIILNQEIQFLMMKNINSKNIIYNTDNYLQTYKEKKISDNFCNYESRKVSLPY